jgi:hypothetical protein
MCAQEEEKSEDVMLLHCATRTSFKCQAKLKFADYITVYIYTYILKPIKEKKKKTFDNINHDNKGCIDWRRCHDDLNYIPR